MSEMVWDEDLQTYVLAKPELRHFRAERKNKEEHMYVRLPIRAWDALIFLLEESMPPDAPPEYPLALREMKKQTGLKGDMHLARSVRRSNPGNPANPCRCALAYNHAVEELSRLGEVLMREDEKSAWNVLAHARSQLLEVRKDCDVDVSKAGDYLNKVASNMNARDYPAAYSETAHAKTALYVEMKSRSVGLGNPKPTRRIEKLLREAAVEGVIHCPKGHTLEPDADKCGICGWRNPLPRMGYI